MSECKVIKTKKTYKTIYTLDKDIDYIINECSMYCNGGRGRHRIRLYPRKGKLKLFYDYWTTNANPATYASFPYRISGDDYKRIEMVSFGYGRGKAWNEFDVREVEY